MYARAAVLQFLIGLILAVSSSDQLADSALSVSSQFLDDVADSDALSRFQVGKRAASMGAIILDRLHKRQERVQERRRSRKEICYDVVGCFVRGKNASPLKKSPQSPDDLDTRFLLFTRKNPTQPEELTYGDKRQSIVNSSFASNKTTKIILHGFKGSSNDRAAVAYVETFLRTEDCNVVLVDWSKGAAGPSYAQVAANTQLIGRQLALLLVDVVSLGADADSVHVIGFSLGAHIGGFAGRAVQQRGVRIGRITGLDPASPLFRQALGTSFPPLSVEDAKFVDVIHTDAAKIWSNGFGLFNPLGHVDYFPNGGMNQPGCAFVRASLLVSHLEGHQNTSAVCNHLRAHQLFLESISNEGCQFSAFPCQAGHDSFARSECFPKRCDVNTTGVKDDGDVLKYLLKVTDTHVHNTGNVRGIDGIARGSGLVIAGAGCGIMGWKADTVPARGPLFLTTRDQLHATVVVSQRTPDMRGYFQLSLRHGQENTAFELYCELKDEIRGGLTLRSTAAARYGTVSPSLTPVLTAHLSYRSLDFQNPDALDPASPHARVFVDSITIADLHGNRWYYCGLNTVLENNDGSSFDVVVVPLNLKKCVV